MNETSNVILIGATGHIGSWVHRYLIEQGFLVTACARHRMSLPPELERATEWRIVDLADAASLKESFNFRPHRFFIHLASEKSVPNAEKNPEHAIEVNVCGTAHVLAAASTAGVRAGIFASSWAVYEPRTDTDYDYREEDACGPLTVYGMTKRLGEDMCLSYQKSGTIPHLSILRFFNTVGGTAYPGASRQSGFFNYVAQAIATGTPVTIAGNDFETPDGTCMRDFIEVRDVASVIMSLVHQEHSGIYNVGSGASSSLEEVVSTFERITGTKIDRNVTAKRMGDPAYVGADISKITTELNFVPKYSLEDMVKSSLP